jgi:hypothetical protein
VPLLAYWRNMVFWPFDCGGLSVGGFDFCVGRAS